MREESISESESTESGLQVRGRVTEQREWAPEGKLKSRDREPAPVHGVAGRLRHPGRE